MKKSLLEKTGLVMKLFSVLRVITKQFCGDRAPPLKLLAIFVTRSFPLTTALGAAVPYFLSGYLMTKTGEFIAILAMSTTLKRTTEKIYPFNRPQLKK
jgi:hypothetical protein